MLKNFWDIVHKVIKDSDILILVLDARFINETRNPEVEENVKASKKPLIYVITKCDLVDKTILDKIVLKPSVFISSVKHLGTTLLRKQILMVGKIHYKDKEKFVVGVLGYPNVGKSSLINAVKGKNSAPSSSVSGFTKGAMKIKADNKILFIDSPGVIPFMEKDKNKHAFIGATEFNKVENPDVAVTDLMEKFPGKIEAYYGIEISEDFEESIVAIAKKRNLLKKGNCPDQVRASRMILHDWQTGKIK
ncbi:50S ribosome-binding GTPase [Candidatus Woesearchaeota archaeon]|nr:50S ribosome-binding GTPase [Candidatus Woesearchaeota archaeon]